MKRRDGFTIGQLADSAGVNLETVRYYERIGVMPEPERTAAGHRAYTVEHRDRLEFIRRARELGFSLDSVQRLIALSESGPQVCSEVKAIAAEHLEEVRAKLADLVRLEAALGDLVESCGDGGPCPVIRALCGSSDARSPAARSVAVPEPA